ncbi:1-acyl-sn-glycerol-3-phosphate acyltransferases/amino acid adenylation domain-containing protein [Ruminococcus sp. YE71]|uniref:non-ribosomal peptide synthetase n=1 Tax=unclassified Ruminococcus TaxID=2608920 RepID=UPI00088B5721|nr:MULTISPECIES: non-ribosomal peptide synthetase [unclassified Ruminococcus]SDA20951.1 1-acyl-sn-glycerol-3-phosphate acyltransferases/amino acid adenylation domain-containing protein [Ruminococcus sp. YE78]SFW33282.1 1-acyl-sn-glycerol-3-phosphate acyltransferases/amino acid adenylation domain-containing protein [Ruminococcus sp. YE71]
MKDTIYQLTSAQKNISELQAFYSDSSISTLCGAIIFDQKLNAEPLNEALRILVRRHESLRLRFRSENGITVQYVSDESAEIGFEKFHSVEEMRSFCSTQAAVRFGTDGGIMYRLTILDLPDKTGIMLCCSHLIADAWSYSVLAHDAWSIYSSLLNKETVDDTVLRYTDSIPRYEAYLQSDKHIKDMNFWADKYSSDIGETAVRNCTKFSDKVSAKRFVTTLSPHIYSRADFFCRQNHISLAALFECAMTLYIARINAAKTITIGVPVLGRKSVSEKNTAGMFVSTIPLTVTINDSDSTIGLCRKVFAAHKEIYRHRDLPFAEIKYAASVSGRFFNVLVSFQNSRTNVPAKTEWFSNGYCELPLAVHIDDRDSRNDCTLTFDYQTEVFRDSREIHLLAERIKHIITQIISREKTVSAISVIPHNEFELLTKTFNDTSVGYEKNKCVHQAFKEIAAVRPNDTALIFHKQKFTYSRIDKMSDSLAAYLAVKGAAKGSHIPIIARRSPYVIIAMLAVMKTGAAYMPISPDYPADRITQMLGAANVKTVLTCGCEYAGSVALETFDYSENTAVNLPEIRPEDSCYVIFTSGSTGRPKAISVTHRNVMNYCAQNRFNVCGGIINGEKRILSVTDIVFDIFVTESILALLRGITIVLADEEQTVSQHALSRLVTETGADILQTTPTKMRGFMLDKTDLSYLRSFRKIILGGEKLPPALVGELKNHTDAEIFNIYGPAETTVWSALTAADERDITIGRPIANTRIYILDADRQLQPVGITGEICIAGDGVSRGYLNDPGLTAEKFVHDPFHGGVMYRTGDMGLMRDDGCIEFCGRRDDQIKLRGLRIELGDIESAICGFEGVMLAAVVCRNERLIGFYTSEKPLDESRLRRFLQRKLPSHMVPNRFNRLEKMPMTQSGKIDRRSLPNADAAVSVRKKISSPKNETERRLCGIMAQILKLPQVSPEDDFFELGGDSFSAMEFASAAAAEGIDLTVRSVYELRTVRQLCGPLGGGQSLSDTEKMLEEKYRGYPQRRTVGDLMFFDTFTAMTKALYRFQVEGLGNLDTKEKYIICPNHESDLDCMWVWAALSRKFHLCETCALIAEEHLDDRLKRFIFRVSGGIPIDRRGDFAPAVRRAEKVLMQQKRLLLIHPEGTRTRTGRLGELKNGAALIAKKTGVKIVPVRICGARQIYPVSRRYPMLFDKSEMGRFTLRIFFGKPIEPKGMTVTEITEKIRRYLAFKSR